MLEPQRLLVIGTAWPMETFLERLLRGLAHNGMQITLASEIKPSQAWLDETGIQWLSVPLWRGIGIASLAHLFHHSVRVLLTSHKDGKTIWQSIDMKKSWRDRLTNWYLLAPFAGQRWDVIYFPWNFAAVAFLPLFDLGMPVVLSCRGSQIHIAPHNPRRANVLPGLRRTFAKAAAVHCVSQDILNEAIGLGLEPAKAHIIHPAVDTDFFHPAEQAHSAAEVFHVITIGSLIWVKGLEYALLAIRKLKDAGVPVHFEIIGDGIERNRVLFTIDDLGLQDCVQFTGCLSPDLIRARLQQADAFLLSSLSEGISNAVLEAMACGLPIVTTDCGGMREAITDGVEGFVVPTRNPQSVADKLYLLANDASLRASMGRAGREKVMEQFSTNDQINAFVRLFGKIA
jgi:glycosyltransferase involved in cell wall biosynthesis